MSPSTRTKWTRTPKSAPGPSPPTVLLATTPSRPNISSPANIELASVSEGFFIVEQPPEDSIDFVSEDQRVLGAAVHLMFARQIKMIVE